MSYDLLINIQWFSIVMLAAESLYLFFKWKTRLQACLFVYCVSTLINNVGYLTEMYARTSSEAFTGTQFAYLGKVWIPLSFFVFIMEFCKVKLSPKLYVPLSIWHLSVFFMVLTSEYHRIYYTGWKFVGKGFFPHNVYGHGPMYIIYMTTIVIYIIVGFATLIKAIRKEKNTYNRKLLGYLFASVITEAGGLVIFLTGITRGYDITALAYTISTVFMYIAIFKYKLVDTLDLAKDYAIDNLSSGVIAVNEDEKIMYYNRPTLSIFPDVDETSDSIIVQLNNIIKEKTVLYKGERIYEPELRPLYQNNIHRGNLYVLIDVTERYKNMEELKEQKRLAEEANASKSAFLSIVSHEMRTPMNAVVGMTDLLLQEDLTDKQRKYMTNIKNSGTSLVMLINDILDQAKIEAGKMDIIEDAYEIRPMLEDVRMIIENRIGDKPIEFQVELDEKIPKLLNGDALRMRQIFINLLNNAVKFTEKGFVKLSAKVESEDEESLEIRFAVEDSGQGIKKEDMDRLFKAFAQVDVKKNHGKEGTGLGLSISANFIALMGGQLSVNSTYGSGSEFFFTIKQGKVPDTVVESDTESDNDAFFEFVAPDARILLVDDTNLNLVVAGEIIKPLGMHIDKATSGEEALELVHNNKYDIIFMDYLMPEMNGDEATVKIRNMAENATDKAEAEYYNSVIIIALTGDISDNTQKILKGAGVNDLIEKPIVREEIDRLIFKWLPRELIQRKL